MNKSITKIQAALFSLTLLLALPMMGEEPQLILDDDWNTWFRVGPTLGFPMADLATASNKLTFAYGGLVGGRFRKIPGNWTVEFLKTESTMNQFTDISADKRAVYTADDIQLLCSWQLPLSRSAGIAPFAEIIFGGILYSSSIEAKLLRYDQMFSVGYMDGQRFTYLVGAGFGTSILVGTVEGGADSRPVGLALQLYGRWLYGGPVPMAQPVSGDYPLLNLSHYQSFYLGFGLLFLL